MMKKIMILLFLLSCASWFTCGEDFEQLIKSNDFSFWLVNEKGRYGGQVANNRGTWTYSYGTSYVSTTVNSCRIEGDVVYISYLIGYFNLYGEPSYRGYRYPKEYTFQITKSQIESNLIDGKDELHSVREVETIATCNALVITDNLRIRTSPGIDSSIDIIGKLNKFDEVELIGCTESSQTIDGLTFPWFKVQLKDNTVGWVFGGFVKIYFFEEEKEMIKKAFAKPDSEYFNQELTPDYS